jgi:hypothetical protein
MTVSGLTMTSASRQPDQVRESQAQKQAVEAGEAKPSALRSFEHAKLVPHGQELKLQCHPGAPTIN